MKTRFLSLALVMFMLLGLFPTPVFADETSSITVKVRAQDGFAHVYTNEALEVTDGIAAAYGFSNDASITTGTVSALDVLVAAHADKYGDAFTKDSAATYLTMGGYGSPQIMFENTRSADFSGFAINHGYPMDLGGTGYTVTNAPISDGDVVDFFYYEDSYWMDYISWFTDASGNAIDSMTVSAGEAFTLKLKGYMLMTGYASPPAEDIFHEDAGMLTVYNANDLGVPLGGITSNAGVTLTFDTAGTYYITAIGFESKYDAPIVSPYCEIVVKAPTPPTELSLKMPESGFYQWSTYAGGSLRSFLVPVNTERSFQFGVTAVPEGADASVKWSVDEPQYVSIDEDTGLLTFNGAQTSSRSFNVTATSTLDPNVSVTSDWLYTIRDFSFYTAPKDITLPANNLTASTTSATVISEYSGAVEWSIDDESIADITTDLTGFPPNSVNIQGLRPGTATLTVMHLQNNALTESAVFTVHGVSVERTDGEAGNRLNITAATPNPTLSLTAYLENGSTVDIWSSSNDAVATVDSNGLVTGKKPGTVIITATDNNGKTGGMQLQIGTSNTPYFERLEFLSGALSNWTNGVTFSPTTLEYDLNIKAYSTSTLTLQATTTYDTSKYTAVASYTDANGDAQEVTVNSGKITYLYNIPFGTSEITVSLTENDNPTYKTAYTFIVTRPRDSTNTIKATSGIVLVPDGRSLLATKYNGKAEGTVFRTQEDGTVLTSTGTSGSVHYYQAYVLEGLDKLALTLAGSTAYQHLRYSTDNAEWTELASGDTTASFAFGDADDITVYIQIISDSIYTATAFDTAGTDAANYRIKITRIHTMASDAQLLTADSDTGDWYPAFNPDSYSYNILTSNGSSTGTLSYTVSPGAKAFIGNVEQTPDVSGVYTLALTTSSKTLTIKNADDSINNSYAFRLSAKSVGVPDRVVDYLVINSQYTNVSSYGYGHELTLSGGVKSLGNFGGYVTYYYDTAITDNPNNRYGVDFYVNGNAFASGASSGEPGQVWVSEDGIDWYALAGSEHYEENTIKNYSITYERTPSGRTAWTDNLGNSNDGALRSGQWPLSQNYPLNTLLTGDSFTLSGILLLCGDGSVTGDGTTNSFAGESSFGYVDANTNTPVNGESNPYDGTLVGSGFDLAWAVDANGEPVSFENGIHYIKVVTASNIWAGSFNDKSTEVSLVRRTVSTGSAVSRTDAPAGVTITDASGGIIVNFAKGKQVYDINVGSKKHISIAVNGAADEDNIYINNRRVAANTAVTGFTVTKDAPTQIRIIVQNGEKEPVIYVLNLTGTAENSSDPIEGLYVNVAGDVRAPAKTDSVIYQMTVGHSINEISIIPTVAPDTTYTINGAAAETSYRLVTGANVFEITAAQGGVTQTISLTVTKQSAPTTAGEITVYVTVLGDAHHNDGSVHTYTKDRGQLETWISFKAYTVDSAATAWDAIKIALDAEGMSYINTTNNYISCINGLAEFDNGPYSGWMYMLNNRYPSLGVSEQSLNNGDSIILHYTDDHTKEKASDAFGYIQQSDNAEESKVVIEPTATVKNGKAVANVTEREINDAIDTAGKNGSDSITIAPKGIGNANSVTVNAPASSLKKIADEADVSLVLQTNSGWVEIPNKTLDAIAEKATGDNISVTVETKTPGDISGIGSDLSDAIIIEVSIESGGSEITRPGGDDLKVSIPVSSEYMNANEYTIVLIDGDGEKSTVTGTCITRDGQKYLEVNLSTLGTLVITAEEIIRDDIPLGTPLPFTDIDGHWAYDAIRYVYENNLMNGVGDNRFAPDSMLTRGMLVTIIYRYEGEPTVTTLNPFIDVNAGEWYSNAIIWASENAIVEGYGNELFGTNDNITREQVAVILMRYAKWKELDVSGSAELSEYTDATQISDWAVEAMSWANSEGLITGVDAVTLSPAGNATRAQIAVILERFYQGIKAFETQSRRDR